ncbi:MAG: hypothetical protein WAU00_13070 [Caldilinea sp.]|nr:hypothetical protein [Anaerolineales bacterium]HQY94145.1 hypothetical protein [Caldilinea sp.]HRA68968.1 hypothetical protein [Caldilinea sp.]
MQENGEQRALFGQVGALLVDGFAPVGLQRSKALGKLVYSFWEVKLKDEW